MKFTQYFIHTRSRPDRRLIQMAWIERVIANPEARETQQDGRLRMWGRIPEFGNKYLRVVLLEDGETLHNAFFDRGFHQ